MKKPVYEAYAGFVKATVGYMILNVGSGGLVTTFRPILAGLNQRFNLSAAVIDPYFGQSAALAAIENVGRTTSLVMVALLVAFVMNILLVALRKVTKLRTVFITGHIMVQQSTTALWLMMLAFPSLADMPTVICLGILLAYSGPFLQPDGGGYPEPYGRRRLRGRPPADVRHLVCG
jgi:PTS system ascorbate-specific IIC component